MGVKENCGILPLTVVDEPYNSTVNEPSTVKYRSRQLFYKFAWAVMEKRVFNPSFRTSMKCILTEADQCLLIYWPQVTGKMMKQNQTEESDGSNFQSVSLLPAVYLVRLYVQKLGKNGWFIAVWSEQFGNHWTKTYHLDKHRNPI